MVDRQLWRLLPTALLTLGALAGPGAGAAWERSAWSDTTYYRADFKAAAAGEAVLHVAAADAYTVYLNGTEVGVDSVWNRVQSHEVEVVRSTNRLAIRVVNEGRGSGTGVLALLVGDSLRWETTTNVAKTPWYWTAEPQLEPGWTTARVNNQSTWGAVQAGTLDNSRIDGWPDAAVGVIAGLAGGIDLGQIAGALTLGTIEGVNLALGRPSNQPKVTDGDLSSSWDPPTNAVNRFAEVDLQARRRITGVRVLTRGPGATQFEANSPRGYSVQVSDDQVTWSEVAEVRGIVDYVWSEARFAPISTRHMRIVIVELDPTTSPRIAEVEVFSLGFREEGVYTSEVFRPSPADGAVNLGRVAWEATVPPGTALSVQLRSGRSQEDFADPEAGWGEPLEADGVWFPGAEPAELLQYRVVLASQDGGASPTFEELRLEYAAESAVSGADAWVSPSRVPMGVDTTFTYVLNLEYGPADRGIERLELAVPGQARLEESASVAALLASWHSSSRLLTLVFAEPLTEVRELVIPVHTRTHASLHAFRAYLYSPGSDNPLNVAETREADPTSGQPRSWTVSASTSRRRVLSQVRARPPVLTPNGDGINDHTVIEFVLFKLEVPRSVGIRIFDLSGRLVRRLPPADLMAGQYAASPLNGLGDRAPGYWDGRDEAGAPVPPGLYLFAVEVDVDSGAEVRRGVVGVAY